MKTEPLDNIPMWGVFIAATVLVLGGMELGYRIGNWRRLSAGEEREASVGSMAGSILGLLAIMLAFTFNLAATRFDARRQAILHEANALGTTYLRTRLLPEPSRSEIAGLLRTYVDTRVKGVEQHSIDETIVRSEALQEEIWSRAVVAAEANPSIMTGLFIQSLNEVIDLHAERVHAGVRSRMPVIIWLALAGVALLGMIATGYQAGLSASRRSPAAILLAIAFSGILVLIVDLDRPYGGMLRVSQAPLVDLQRSMQH
jgi:hypothetical protein